MNSAALALSVNALALGFSVLLGFSPSAVAGFFSSSFAFGGRGGEWGLGGGAAFPVIAVTPAPLPPQAGALGTAGLALWAPPAAAPVPMTAPYRSSSS